MKIKVISILMCLILVVTVFSGCGKKPSIFPNGFLSDAGDVTTTTTTANGNANNSSIEETVTDKDGNPVSTSKPNGTTTQDSRLVGKWNAKVEIPIDNNGSTVSSTSTIEFKSDGTFQQSKTEAQARREIIDTYLVVFGCETEEELSKYIIKNKKATLEGYVAMALAQMTDEDFCTKGTWKTKNNNTLYETIKYEGENVVETITYTVSNDGSTVKMQLADGTGGKLTMILTKA